MVKMLLVVVAMFLSVGCDIESYNERYKIVHAYDKERCDMGIPPLSHNSELHYLTLIKLDLILERLDKLELKMGSSD